MKRLLAPMLLAAIVGAAVATVAVLTLAAGGGGSAPSVSTTKGPVRATASTAGTRREASSTALTATQIYQRDCRGRRSDQGGDLRRGGRGNRDRAQRQGSDPDQRSRDQGRDEPHRRRQRIFEKTTSAKIVGVEANQDLALIEVDPSGLGLHAADARKLELTQGRRHRVRASAPPTASKRRSPKASSRRSTVKSQLPTARRSRARSRPTRRSTQATRAARCSTNRAR